ncbi:hypothetical protein FACS189418_4250 [Clostridia bacterium]|nr:hypothetical protein FACS189418_4250 [Clostridia bacterium]
MKKLKRILVPIAVCMLPAIFVLPGCLMVNVKSPSTGGLTNPTYSMPNTTSPLPTTPTTSTLPSSTLPETRPTSAIPTTAAPIIP